MLVALAYSSPVFENIHNQGIADWDQHFFYHEVPAKSVLEYGQLPLWNPYYSGGNALLAYPQTRIITPFFGLHLAFDTPVALKLELFLHLAIGLIGGWVLCRYLGARSIISLAGALIILGNGIYAHRMIGGHTWFFSQAYFPWVIYFLLRCLRDKRPVWPAALLIALMLFEGGIYTVPHVLIYCGLIALIYAGLTRSLTPIWRMLQLVAITCGLAAVKLLPFLDFFRRFPRHIDSTDSLSPTMLWNALTVPDIHAHPELLTNAKWAFIEYAAYIGAIPAVIAIVFFFICLATRWRTNKLLAAAVAPGLVFVLLALGSLFPYSPWDILHHLPVFKSMHVPTRFLPGFLLALGIAFATGVTALELRLRQRCQDAPLPAFKNHPKLATALPTAAVIALTIWTIGDITYQNRTLLEPVFRIAPLPQQAEQPFRQVLGNEVQMYAHAKANLGSIRAYEMMTFGPHAVPAESRQYRGEVHLLQGGTSAYAYWSPNVLEIDYSSPVDDILVINQNYSPDWSSPSGHVVIDHEGLIAVYAPSGDNQRIVLSYQPLSFTIGVGVSLLTIVLLGYASYRRKMKLSP